MSSNVSILDLVFVVFAFIFVVTAFFRGFVKEIFSLFNWGLSLTLSYLLAPYATDVIATYSKSKLVADISARSIIFVVVFFITALSTAGLCKVLKEKIPKVFDRSLGVFYGLIKTLLIFGFICSLAFNLYEFLLGKKVEANSPALPRWFVEAKSRNILVASAQVLDPTVKLFFSAIVKNFDYAIPKPTDLDEKINELSGVKTEVIDGNEGEAKSLNSIGTEQMGKALEDSGYNKKDIEKMNRLIEIIGK